ncbi:MAG TPA: HTH domain-containing protein [Mucilaginibacter sp.]|jgi:restriction system protein
MAERTINDAIKIALKNEKHGLTVKEIYNRIILQQLYNFNSPTPEHIVQTQIRRRCETLDFKSAFKEKWYKLVSPGKYALNAD